MNSAQLAFARVGIISGLAFGLAAEALAKPGAQIAGISFVDSSVTSAGSRARLPEGAKIYPLGTKITGSVGCSTTQYRTDGLIVAVIDYIGPPTIASLEIRQTSSSGAPYSRAPYQIDLNPGRTLQYLGPISANGVYEIAFSYGYEKRSETSGWFELSRSCFAPP